MSFELSPEAVIFSLRSQITKIQDEIIDLENRFAEIPEQRFRTVEVRNIQGFFDGTTTQKLIFDATRNSLIQGNNKLGDEIIVLKQRISSINSQITLLEKDIEVKQIPSIDLQEIELLPRQNNNLRNALLIGGALLLL